MLDKKRMQLRSFFGTQQLQDKEDEGFWKFEDEKIQLEFEKIVLEPRKNMSRIFEILTLRFSKGLEQKDNGNISKLAFVLHDKDTDENGKIITPHVHWLLELKQKRDLNEIAYRFFVNPQQLDKGSPGKNGMMGRIGYLTHQSDPDKFKYTVEDVETFGTFNYVKYIEDNKIYFEKKEAQNRKKLLRNDVDYYLQKVQQGKLFLEDILNDKNLYILYANNKKKFKDAFESYTELNSYQTIQERKNGNFEFITLYIYGNSGTGKTTIALAILEKLISMAKNDGLKWRAYSGSAKNAVDDYKGQELILFDDLKRESFSISDWLKILDPRNESTISGRFHNRPLSARLIILTTVHDPFKFFNFGTNEPKEQFIRRLKCVVRLESCTLNDEEMTGTTFSINSPIRENNYHLKESYKEIGLDYLLESEWLKIIYEKIKIKKNLDGNQGF